MRSVKLAFLPKPEKQNFYKVKSFQYTESQQNIIKKMLLKKNEDCNEICLYGGGRSGKSMLICIFLIQRAIMSPNSHHIILRNTAISAKNSIFRDTLLTKLANFQQFRDIFLQAHKDKTSMIITFKNGSTIQIFGMDHIDKVLGMECSTLYFNECSEIDYKKIQVVISRLAEKATIPYLSNEKNKEKVLKNLIFYDYNPIYKTHWTYKYFEKRIDPITGRPLNHNIFVEKLNTIDNLANIDQNYIKIQKENGNYKRFVLGEYEDEVQGAIFKQESIVEANNHQMHGWKLTDLRKIMSQVVIGVDPAVTDGENSDNTGIVVAGTNGEDFYVLEDKSGKYSEEVVCATIVNLFKKWQANSVIVETNQGGSWIPSSMLAYCKNHSLNPLPIKTVHAIYNKRTRAEPVAVLYSNKKVKHIQDFDCEERPQEHKLMPLENELLSYTGSKKEKSPDRMDAMVYAITALMEEKPKITYASFIKGFYDGM